MNKVVLIIIHIRVYNQNGKRWRNVDSGQVSVFHAHAHSSIIKDANFIIMKSICVLSLL